MKKQESIRLNNKNNFIGQNHVYIVKNNDVYRFDIVAPFDSSTDTVYTLICIIKNRKRYLAFSSKEIRQKFINKMNERKEEQ